MIVNPISYPGNKTKLIKEIKPQLDNSCQCFVDVFAGSGMVAVNSDYQKLFCNDISNEAISLLKYFYDTDSQVVITRVEKIIDAYGLTYSRVAKPGTYVEEKHEGLSRYNKYGYELLKKDYNHSHDIDKLFVLLIYGFNHYMRYNKFGEFNVPVGKVDFSKSIYCHTIEFVDGIKEKEIRFSTKDFRDKALYRRKNAFYYFDPPYLVTTAPYNSIWGEQDELDLLELLDWLDCQGSKFALSNVLMSNGKVNSILKKWSKNYCVIPMKRQYRNANYQKVNIASTEEVLIKNY